MFNVSVEKRIQQEVLEQTGIRLSNEQVHKMKTVPDTEEKANSMMISLKVRKTVILVPLRISGNGQDIIVDQIQTVTVNTEAFR